ncbi:MAG: hypothetical protein QXZ56_05945 [Sulfolobales archaeon]
MKKSHFIKTLTVVVVTLGIVTSLLCLWFAFLSTHVITLHNPKLRTYNSFDVSKYSVSLRGYGYGLEFSEVLSGDVEIDVSRRMGFRVDYVFSYVFRDASCGILSLYNLSLERIPLIPYDLTYTYEILYPREISINITDFDGLISKSCVYDRSGYLYINIFFRYSYLITDPKYPEVRAVTLQRVLPHSIMYLKIPVEDDGITLRLVRDDVTYLISSPFTEECKTCGIEKRCSEEICTYTFRLTELESFSTIREVSFKPHTTLENERVLMSLFIPMVISLLTTSSLLIYHYLKGIPEA